jgi:hypothetical protein
MSTDDFLVECPNCGGKLRVPSWGMTITRFFDCPHCSKMLRGDELERAWANQLSRDMSKSMQDVGQTLLKALPWLVPLLFLGCGLGWTLISYLWGLLIGKNP